MKRWGMQPRFWRWVALVSLVVAGVGAAWAERLPTPPTGLSALNPPIVMPSFHLPNVDGTRVDSTTLKGRVLVVRFWATW